MKILGDIAGPGLAQKTGLLWPFHLPRNKVSAAEINFLLFNMIVF